MRERFFALLGTLAVMMTAASLAQVAVAGQAQKTAVNAKPSAKSATKTGTAPRTPWGDPDLQGVFTSDEVTGVPVERPRDFGERQFLTEEEFAERVEQARKQVDTDSEALVVPRPPAPAAEGGAQNGRGAGTGPPSHWATRGKPQRQASLIVDPPDGRIPFISSEAQQRAAAAERRLSTLPGPFNGPEDLDMWDRCITRRLPRAMFPNGEGIAFQFVQTPGYVAITYEMVHETRIIPLDGRPHLSPGIRQYFGDSRGHWEGDTLVVDVTNFNDKTQYQGSGLQLHLIERFTRLDTNVLRYEVTVDDPTTFTRPWTATFNLTPRAGIFEYACHEGNFAMANILSASRAEENATENGAKKR